MLLYLSSRSNEKHALSLRVPTPQACVLPLVQRESAELFEFAQLTNQGPRTLCGMKGNALLHYHILLPKQGLLFDFLTQAQFVIKGPRKRRLFGSAIAYPRQDASSLCEGGPPRHLSCGDRVIRVVTAFFEIKLLAEVSFHAGRKATSPGGTMHLTPQIFEHKMQFSVNHVRTNCVVVEFVFSTVHLSTWSACGSGSLTGLASFTASLAILRARVTA